MRCYKVSRQLLRPGVATCVQVRVPDLSHSKQRNQQQVNSPQVEFTNLESYFAPLSLTSYNLQSNLKARDVPEMK